MRGSFYPQVFSAQGIELVLPDPQEQAYIHDKYMHEWVNGVFDQNVRQRLLDMVQSLKQREHIQGVYSAVRNCRCTAGALVATRDRRSGRRLHQGRQDQGRAGVAQP